MWLLVLVACRGPVALPAPPTEIRVVEAKYEAAGLTARAATATVAGPIATGVDVSATIPSKTVPSKTIPSKDAEAPPIVVKASRSDWDLRARIAHFEGDVRVIRGDVELRCARIEVRYADADHVDTVTASGGVTVTRGAQEARADAAVLVGRTGEITLTGSPSLRDGPNQLIGTRIVLHLDDERVRCEGEGDRPCRLEIAGSALPR